MVRVAAYIRVSTDEQVDKGNSLHEQKERLEAYCKAMGWLAPVIYSDDGYSAKDMRRPAAQKMIKGVQKNKYDVLLTSKLDRMSRNLLDMLQLVRLLDEHGCNYVSASEGFDTSTAVGRMVLQLLAAFAEFERERISERVKDNMISMAKNTDRAINMPCYGYDILEGKYSINTKEAENIRLMFDLAENGHGYRAISKTLNEKGIRTKKDKEWTPLSVKRVIKNDTLAGTMTYNKRQMKNGKMVFRDESEWIVKLGNHPAIIELEKWKKVIAILESRKPAKKHADSETYILTGLVKCGYCGRTMKGSTARYNRSEKKYIYYRYMCSSYQRGFGCKYHAVHRDEIETAVINQIKELATYSTKEVREVSITSSMGRSEIQEIESDLEKINRRIQKQIEAFTSELITPEDLKRASQKAEKERAELQVKMERIKSREIDMAQVKRKINEYLDVINGIDRVKSKQLLRQMISNISYKDGTASITWDFKFSLSEQ